jgi:hypothetical protein
LTLSREEFAALKAQADALGDSEPDGGWVRADPNLPPQALAFVLSIRLPGDQLFDLETAAQARKTSMSQLARGWVLERLKQEGDDPQRRHELLGAELARYQQGHGVFTKDELAEAQARIDDPVNDPWGRATKEHS